MKTQYIQNWQLSYLENKTVNAENFRPTTGEEVNKRLTPIKANVPGNFELDMTRENLLPDLYLGTNVLLAQKLENLHLYYNSTFDYEADDNTDDFLVFDGIDTVAEIYLDGEKIGFTENMLHSHDFPLKNLSCGKHDLLVHIFPTAVYARNFDLPAMCFGLKYNADSMQMRKAPYSFGWDIMPRIVSGGLWKEVKIEKRNRSRIENPFTYTEKVIGNIAVLKTSLKVVTDEDFIQDFNVKLQLFFNGELCSETVQRCFSANQRIETVLKNAKLWFPKNYGDANLYDVKVQLCKKGEPVDETTYRIGVRTVKLRRTSRAGENGEFCFEISGQKVFCLGTNWVPSDAFPSRQKDFDLRGLRLLDDVGCNMIRCWGGNIYPSQELYDYCDEHGIMIWQDFSFGCGHYPKDERLCALTEEEVKKTAIAYRNHPSLCVWAGDNECDTFIVHNWGKEHSTEDVDGFLDPNQNYLSRNVILRELREHDATRPYLPSSPYLDETAYAYGLPSEDHLWGPRDYFKGDFYKNPVCHFASEIGYHGCNSPESLRKFIPENSLNDMGSSSGCDNPDWLVHAAGMETTTTEKGNPYAYRIPLMISQVERIFLDKSDDLNIFAMQSQISQAEADKYFIERFRIEKWRKTGIIWWNIIDGWPQISDAVVDYYGQKKLAFHYIKRAQQPFVIIIGEPVDGKMNVTACNDLQQSVKGKYTVTNLVTGKTVQSGEIDIEKNTNCVLAKIPEIYHAFYLIEWHTNIGNGVNHHTCSLDEKWKFKNYYAMMEKAGFANEFEGFDKIESI